MKASGGNENTVTTTKKFLFPFFKLFFQLAVAMGIRCVRTAHFSLITNHQIFFLPIIHYMHLILPLFLVDRIAGLVFVFFDFALKCQERVGMIQLAPVASPALFY